MAVEKWKGGVLPVGSLLAVLVVLMAGRLLNIEASPHGGLLMYMWIFTLGFNLRFTPWVRLLLLLPLLPQPLVLLACVLLYGPFPVGADTAAVVP